MPEWSFALAAGRGVPCSTDAPFMAYAERHLLPCRVPATSVREIVETMAHQRLSASEQLTKNRRRCGAFAAALESLAPCGGMARREDECGRLTTAARGFVLRLSPALTRAQAVRTATDSVVSQPAARPPRVHR